MTRLGKCPCGCGNKIDFEVFPNGLSNSWAEDPAVELTIIERGARTGESVFIQGEELKHLQRIVNETLEDADDTESTD